VHPPQFLFFFFFFFYFFVGTFLEFQKVYKRASNLSTLPTIDPWLMEVKLKKKIEDAVRAENDFKDAVLELHDDFKVTNSTTSNKIASTVVNFSVLRKEQITFIRDCVDQVAKVTMAQLKPCEKPAYLAPQDGRIVPALTRRGYTQSVRYPDRAGPFSQVVKQGFMLKMKVPQHYTRKDVREDRWDTVSALVTECGFLHFFDTNDRLMTDPLHTIHLAEAEFSSDLTLADVGGAEAETTEDPFLRLSARSDPRSEEEAAANSLDESCFEITAAVPTAFFAAMTEKLLVRSSNAMEAIDWLATLHFYKGEQGKTRVFPTVRRTSVDYAPFASPTQAVPAQASGTPPTAHGGGGDGDSALSLEGSTFSQPSVGMPMSLDLRTSIPPPPTEQQRGRTDTWPTVSNNLRQGQLSERVVDLHTMEVSWERRDVEIRHGKLTCYDISDPATARKKSKRVVNLEGGQVSVLDPADDGALFTPWGFRVFGNGDSVTFCCESEAELELWLQALRLACTWPPARREPRFVFDDEEDNFNFLVGTRDRGLTTSSRDS